MQLFNKVDDNKLASLLASLLLTSLLKSSTAGPLAVHISLRPSFLGAVKPVVKRPDYWQLACKQLRCLMLYDQ